MECVKAYISGYKSDDISYCGSFIIVDKLPEGHAKQVRLAPEQEVPDVFDYDFYEVDITDEEADNYIVFYAVKKEQKYKTEHRSV